MHKTFALSAALAIAVSAGSAEAGFRFPGGMDAQDRYEQRQILDEEFRRAREVGGYNDPITALVNLLSGTATERDVRPAVNTIFDVPGRRGIRLKTRWDD